LKENLSNCLEMYGETRNAYKIVVGKPEGK
jgi:hypothetical protein